MKRHTGVENQHSGTDAIRVKRSMEEAEEEGEAYQSTDDYLDMNTGRWTGTGSLLQ